MQIPFEQDIPADPIAPGEPLVADQAAKADIAPIEAPTVEPVDPSAAATPDEETTLPGTSDADTDAARRRITMQLYSRMVTDLKVLTGDTRVPTDDEIDDALNRAMRAHGLGSAALHGVRGGPATADITFAAATMPSSVIGPNGTESLAPSIDDTGNLTFSPATDRRRSLLSAPPGAMAELRAGAAPDSGMAATPGLAPTRDAKPVRTWPVPGDGRPAVKGAIGPNKLAYSDGRFSLEGAYRTTRKGARHPHKGIDLPGTINCPDNSAAERLHRHGIAIAIAS